MNTERHHSDKPRANKTVWTEKRLLDLFARYNRKYWLGRLPVYRLVIAPLHDARGLCESIRRVISIDVDHKSDRKVRGTLLHQMAHAAARSGGHSLGFFAQVEMLLEKGAPIDIDAGDAGNVPILTNVVPSSFPLFKRKIDQADARRIKGIDRVIAEKDVPLTLITDDDILVEFEEAAELTWNQAVMAVGRQYGLVDDTRRALTPRTRRLLDKAKPRHARARRNYLRFQKFLVHRVE
jgi:hypothetical protein